MNHRDRPHRRSAAGRMPEWIYQPGNATSVTASKHDDNAGGISESDRTLGKALRCAVVVNPKPGPDTTWTVGAGSSRWHWQ